MAQGIINLDTQPLPAPLKITGDSGNLLPWKLNQVVRGVVETGKGGQLRLLIDGQPYSAKSVANLVTGESYNLKVISLQPQVGFSVVGAASTAAATVGNPGIVISGQLAKPILKNRTSIASIFEQVGRPESSSMQSLSTDTRGLLESIRKQIIGKTALAQPEKLRAAIDDSGLFLESKLGGITGKELPAQAIINKDLKFLLLKLFTDLGNRVHSPAQHKNIKADPQAFGIAQYRDSENRSNNMRMQIMEKVEESLRDLGKSQRGTMEEADKGNLRWLFELPVNFGPYMGSVALIISGGSVDNSSDTEQTLWKAEFIIELENSGTTKVELSIFNEEVSVAVHCETAESLAGFEKHGETLGNYLQSSNLSLKSLNCTVLEGKNSDES